MKAWLWIFLVTTFLAGSVAEPLAAGVQASTSAEASVTLKPDTAGARDVQWTVHLLVPYCGGYRIGGYVLLRFTPPFLLPAKVPAAAVSFADGPAIVRQQGDTMQVAPSPGRIWSMLCGPKLPLDIVLSATAGLSNPVKAGTYAIQVSTDADPTPVVIPVVVRHA